MSDDDSNTSAYVYILGAAGTNRTKIGRTNGTIADRIASLQTGNPFVIVERDHIATHHSSKIESYLHALLATSRGKTGEWFEVSDDDLQPALIKARKFAAHLEATTDQLTVLADAVAEDREEALNDLDGERHLSLLALYSDRCRLEAEIEMLENELKLYPVS